MPRTDHFCIRYIVGITNKEQETQAY